MNIIKDFDDKINGILQTFDRLLINGYLSHLFNYNKFLYYLIENKVKLKDFKEFANQQTGSLCGKLRNIFKLAASNHHCKHIGDSVLYAQQGLYGVLQRKGIQFHHH